jgi:type I restriction enzyme S subunit
MKVTEIYDAEDHVSQRALSETSLKSIPPESVLLVVRGMILAHTVPLALTRAPTTINQDVKAIAFDTAINPLVGLWCLKVQHNHILSKVSSAAHGTKRLDMNEVAQLPILLPTKRQQERFALAASNAAQNSRCAIQSGKTIYSVFSSLQSRAFSGQL